MENKKKKVLGYKEQFTKKQEDEIVILGYCGLSYYNARKFFYLKYGKDVKVHHFRQLYKTTNLI